jgi:small subunit ribosomal protein S4
MFNTKEKRERSLGTQLFLKADRCNSPKCAAVRTPNRPGLHGKKRRRAGSEYAQQLMEKQKIKFTYGLREAQLQKVFKAALKNPGVTGELIISLLEKRLDNAVYRLGLAPSRSVARQLVGHGHILVNKKRVNIPSCQIKIGDTISIREASKTHFLFKDLSVKLKSFETPSWLELDKENLTGKVVVDPKKLEIPFDINMVVDYYSK